MSLTAQTRRGKPGEPVEEGESIDAVEGLKEC